MGWLSDTVDKVKDTFSGGSSKTSSGSSNDSYTSTNTISNTRPKSRPSGTPDTWAGGGGSSDENRQASGGGTLVSGPGTVTGTQQGVSVNAFGVPQYDYSEVGDGEGGYSKYYDANPSSSISEQQYMTQKTASTLAALFVSPAIGLTARTVTELQKRGVLPNVFGGVGVSDSEAGPVDAQLQAILNSTGDENAKRQQLEQVLNSAAQTAAAEQNNGDRATAAAQLVNPMVDAAYGNSAASPQDIFSDPNTFITADMKLSGNTPTLTAANGTMMDGNAAYANGDPSQFNVTATTANPAGTVQNVDPATAQGYDPALAYDKVATDGQGNAAQGTVSNNALVDAEQIDTQATADGNNAIGAALNDYATQDISRIIDTSTVAGKLLAQELGEGNYTDAKATVAGQMEILSAQFVDADGNPKIPSWAAGAARNVAKIAAFKGMTGTAATAAMSQAIMEASLPIAQQDAQFFQTTTLQNLDNRQQATVQKAQILANFELANLDARMQAAVTNSQAFLAMDMANLDNEQQMAVLNTQNRVQAILEDQAAQNAARLFSAEAANDFTKFYDELNSQISMFNTEQLNSMEMFNAGEINDASQFNASLESSRQQFYSNMQYNIDLSNAKWRQTIETENTAMAFEAAQLDVQNMFNLSQEALNQMWDREDAILDYTWKTADNELDRETQRYAADRNYDIEQQRVDNDADAAEGAGWYEAIRLGLDVGESLSWW